MSGQLPDCVVCGGHPDDPCPPGACFTEKDQYEIGLESRDTLIAQQAQQIEALQAALAHYADLDHWRPLPVFAWEFLPGKKLAPNEHPAGVASAALAAKEVSHG